MNIYEKNELEILNKKTRLTSQEQARKEVLKALAREDGALVKIKEVHDDPQDLRKVRSPGEFPYGESGGGSFILNPELPAVIVALQNELAGHQRLQDMKVGDTEARAKAMAELTARISMLEAQGNPQPVAFGLR